MIMENTENIMHKLEGKVRQHECDSLGIVYHANYALFLHNAFSEYFSIINKNNPKTEISNLNFELIKQTINYRSILMQDDAYVIETAYTEIAKNEVTFFQKIFRVSDHTLIVEGTSTGRLNNVK
jgi:acyl-CoA thioester hydrolase